MSNVNKYMQLFFVLYVYFEYNLKNLPVPDKILHSIGDGGPCEENAGINSEFFLRIFPFKLWEGYAILEP